MWPCGSKATNIAWGWNNAESLRRLFNISYSTIAHNDKRMQSRFENNLLLKLSRTEKGLSGRNRYLWIVRQWKSIKSRESDTKRCDFKKNRNRPFSKCSRCKFIRFFLCPYWKYNAERVRSFARSSFRIDCKIELVNMRFFCAMFTLHPLRMINYSQKESYRFV